MYVDEQYYMSHFDDLPKGFSRLRFQAERLIDNMTTGVDGVSKLKTAFPVNPEDSEAVKMCVCEIIDTMDKIQKAEAAAARVTTANGVHGGVISSMSAGNESISYANNQTTFDRAVNDLTERKKMYTEKAFECLRGICDANGVNLLYMGAYPR